LSVLNDVLNRDADEDQKTQDLLATLETIRSHANRTETRGWQKALQSCPASEKGQVALLWH
jgi:hypothetical protein